MQVLNVEGFEKRILYNAAKSYSIQLTTGQGYNLLNPVIALTITDFVMFADLPHVTSRFVLDELDEQEKSEIFIQDQRGAVTKAAKENLEQGRKEGLQQGLEQGLEQGIAQGLRLKAYEIARKMLDVLEDQAIADMTGLTLEELQSLRS